MPSATLTVASSSWCESGAGFCCGEPMPNPARLLWTTLIAPAAITPPTRPASIPRQILIWSGWLVGPSLSLTPLRFGIR
jgi:hypothetical protein